MASEHVFEIWQEGIMVVKVTSSERHRALQEVAHYAAQYEQDGPIEIREGTESGESA